MVNYTPDGLPVISEETILYLTSLFNRKDDLYMGDFKDRLEVENQNLNSFFEGMLSCGEADIENKNAFIVGFFFAYEALRRQSAANKLEREIEGK